MKQQNLDINISEMKYLLIPKIQKLITLLIKKRNSHKNLIKNLRG